MEKARGNTSQKRRRLGVRVRTLLCVLASLIITCCIALITCVALSLPDKRSPTLLITLACHASSSPKACQSSFRLSPHATTPAHLVAIAVSLARERVQLCHSLSQALLSVQSHNPKLVGAARNCEYLLCRASHVLEECTVYINDAVSCYVNAENSRVAHMMGGQANFKKPISGFAKIKDMEAWMSAALTWENDCYSALGYVNGTFYLSHYDVPHHGKHANHIAKHSSHDRMYTRYYAIHASHDMNHPYYHSTYATYILDHATHDGSHAVDPINNLMQHVSIAITLTSNALSMLDAYDTYGPNVSVWSPPSKRSLPGFPNLQHSDKRVWHTDNIKGLVPTVTVSKDGLGAYSSIQDAVDDAPENASERFVIYIKQGIYNETVRVPYTKPFLAFVGDGMGKTIITGNMNAQMPGVSTYDTATVAVDGDGFLAYNLTFENTAHPDLHQAVALRVGSDLSAFYDCSFLGHQDTLYAHSLRQFYQNCRIEGTMDFIFGNAASIFRDCEVLIRPGRISSSVITAHGRTDPAQTTGFVFENCLINGTEEFMENFVLNPKKYKVYLGRPWKMYSRTIYKNCVMESIVRPEGWRPWGGDFALDTLFYGEYNNSGNGSNATGRVEWSEQISSSVAKLYTVSNFIQGNDWLPSTHVQRISTT